MRETQDWFSIETHENGQVYAIPHATFAAPLHAAALREMLTAVEAAERAQMERQIPRQPGTPFVWNGESYVTMRTADAAPAFHASRDTMGALFALHVKTGSIKYWERPTETHRTYPFRLRLSDGWLTAQEECDHE